MKLIKSICKATLVLAAVSLFASPLQAEAAPYEGYTYSYWGIGDYHSQCLYPGGDG